MAKFKLPNVPEWYSVNEMFNVWKEAEWWHVFRRDKVLPQLRKDIRDFRESEPAFSRERRKKFLLGVKTDLTQKIVELSDKVDAMDIPEWEKKWLMERAAKWQKIIKKINGELRYVYGKPKGSIDDADIARAREVDVSDLVEGLKRGVAPCLWHDEKTPSMKVYPAGRGVHCFGCNFTGSSIDVIMKVQSLSFVQAVKYLRDYGK